MYAVFVNESYERICISRKKAIEVMLEVVASYIRTLKHEGKLTPEALHSRLHKDFLHMALMVFRNDVCNLGHNPDLLQHAHYYEIPEIQRYIESELKED